MNITTVYKLCLLLVLSCSCRCYGQSSEILRKSNERRKGLYNIWRPLWDQKSYLIGGIIEPLETPFKYYQRKSKTYSSREEAEYDFENMENSLILGKKENCFYVKYLEIIDLNPLFTDVQREVWLGPKHQYAVFKALERSLLSVSSAIATNNQFYLINSFLVEKDEKSLLEKVDLNKHFYKKATDDDGSPVYIAYRLEPFDLLAAAQPHLQRIEFVEEWGIDGFEGLRYGFPRMGNGVTLYDRYYHGWNREISYCVIDDPNKRMVAGAEISRADQPMVFDDILGKYYSGNARMKVVGDKPGEVVVRFGNYLAALWMSDERTFMLVNGREEVIQAYLKRYPSILPVNTELDQTGWCRRQVVRLIEQLENHADKETDDKEQSDYQNTYQTLCRFIKPVPDAPIIRAHIKKISKDEERYHNVMVKKWWTDNRNRFTLRPQAPVLGITMLKEAHSGTKDKDDDVTAEFRRRARNYWAERRKP